MRTCVTVLVDVYLKMQNMIWKPHVSYVRRSDMPVISYARLQIFYTMSRSKLF